MGAGTTCTRLSRVHNGPVAPPVVVLLAGLLVIPLAAVIGIGFWTRWLRRKGSVPRFAMHTAYGFVVLSGAIVAVAVGLVLVALAGRGGDTAVKRAAAAPGRTWARARRRRTGPRAS